MTRFSMLSSVAFAGLIAAPASGQWVVFTEDPSRLSAAAGVGAADPEEKDYAWGDIDRDGDIDLVVARKQPWTTTGRRTNVLFLNEGGVLTDRTADYAVASSISGDLGFLTPTNDRDVVLVDVNGDEWLDIVTAPTLTDNDAKHLSHPRVYINQAEAAGAWQGVRYEDDRIPQMHATAGPRFCGVSAGDVTGDGFPDLFFSDYDVPPGQLFDFNDRLLVNNGAGGFSDQTVSRLTPAMYVSTFGISNDIVDMNGDGFKDIVRLTANGVPYEVGIAYNNPDNVGFFTVYDQVYGLSPYHSAVGDLNGDGLMDIVVLDDGSDQYLLNQGNNAQGFAEFSSTTFPPPHIFNAGNVVVEDFDKDGFNDVINMDADVTIPGCTFTTRIFHNQGNPPEVTFVEEGEVIPLSMLNGVHDMAAFDIDGNGWTDLVIGRCSGTQVWMNFPPVAVAFSYPGGLPVEVVAGEPTLFGVQLDPVGGEIVPGATAVHVSINDGPFTENTLTDLGGNLFEAELPGAGCGDRLDFYLSTELDGGEIFLDPPTAPASTYHAVATTGSLLVLADAIEGDVSGWTVTSDPSLTGGAWKQADPVPTIFNSELAAPGNDATPDPDGTMAFVTENGNPGGAANASDVDGGPAYLLSPLIDLDGTDGMISYARWVFSATGVEDLLTVEISNDAGVNWTLVESVASTGSVWETASFQVGAHVTPTGQLQVRFGICDCPNDSVTEAGIDDFTVTDICPQPPNCLGDVDGDGEVGISDFLAVLGNWGPNPGHPADLDGDGEVGITDFLQVLGNWGPC